MKIRPAQATLNELNSGRVMILLAEAIHDAIAATKQFGKPATVSLDITVSITKDMQHLIDPPVIISGDVTTKLPKSPPPATVFFVDEDGNPVRNTTREPELPLSVAKIGGEQT